MRTLAWLTLLLLALGCTAARAPSPAPSSTPETPAAELRAPSQGARAPRAPVPLAAYGKVRVVKGASFSHDESLVAYVSTEGDKIDLWVQPVAQGQPRQLTHTKGSVASFAFSPREDLLLFAGDQEGDELTRLYLTDSTGKAPVALFPGDPKGSRQELVAWSPDGKRFLYTSSRRDPRYLDLYDYELATGRSTRLWESSGKLSFALASRDHGLFVVQETVSDADSNLYLLKRGEKKLSLLTPHAGAVLFAAADFSPDGKRLYVVSDEAGEFQGLYAIELRTRKKTPVGATQWDTENAFFSDGGRYLFQIVNADGAAEVSITDQVTSSSGPLPPVGAPGPLVPLTTSRTDRYLAALIRSELAPTALWLIDLKEKVGRPLMDPLPETLRRQAFAPATSVRVRSFDGRDVPAFLYAPGGAQGAEPPAGGRPAIIVVHGGPTAQSRRIFDPFVQYMASKGYVVLVPNVRGSTGYGKTYTQLDNKDLGGAPLRDVVACKAWLVAHAGVDPARVVILGASYGGYMALAAATFTPKEFAAHVDIFGPSDLKSLVETFPAYWTAFATYLYKKFGDPKDPADAAYQRERSPLYFADRIERPLLVVQGTNDPRVNKDQSDRIVESLRARRIPVEYLVVPGEGHGFAKNESWLLVMETVDRFLDQHLFGAAPGSRLGGG